MRKLPPLAALRAFEATARHLSAKRAADELAVTPTAVSHQIRHLEDHLGLALFVRRPRQLVLTADGKTLYEALRSGFDLMEEALAKLRTGHVRQPVTVSATPAFAAKWLLPRIAAFREANPGHDLRIHVSAEPVALDGRTADVAVRYGKGPWPGLVARKLFDNVYVPACSPSFKPGARRSLRGDQLIHFEWQPGLKRVPDWRAWREAAGSRKLDVESGLVFSDETHAIHAAMAGQGVALLGRVLIKDELERGVLVQPFGPELEGEPYQLVCEQGRRDEAGVMAVCRWIASAARAFQ
jgi:LysR family glycine cleavage system transcriptional activator